MQGGEVRSSHQAHNLEIVGSNPTPAIISNSGLYHNLRNSTFGVPEFMNGGSSLNYVTICQFFDFGCREIAKPDPFLFKQISGF